MYPIKTVYKVGDAEFISLESAQECQLEYLAQDCGISVYKLNDIFESMEISPEFSLAFKDKVNRLFEQLEKKRNEVKLLEETFTPVPPNLP